MAFQRYLWCTGLVGVLAALSGCTTSAPWGQTALAKPLLAKPLLQKKQVDERPPEPVPALYIPGPPLAKPASPPGGSTETLVIPVSGVGGDVKPALPEKQAAQSQGEPLPALKVAPPSTLETGRTDSTGSPLRDLYEKALKKYESMDSCVWRLRRREVVGNENRPEEVMLLKFRREPWSVYLKWLGPEAKGREVVYVKGQYENLIHTLLASGDVLLMPAGTRFKIAPDSPFARAKSRYPITEAGMGPLIERFGRLVSGFEKGDPKAGTAKYIGPTKRAEFDHELIGVLQTIPPKADSLFPHGGQRLWFFDPVLHLPVLVYTQENGGREVEYYCYDRLQYPVRLDDDDFNPDVLWKKK